ncbi:MAG: hypothetical protein L0332_13505 [Chloroflexi bacterium]|nr:hypothetical protein [Chloroflexota bacterium]MCI0575906.1 hypothetical protein [Chloroflexota bacterium]MCI0648299.1 hypothetical protein [Chloroflexota bacterium]MCI0727720.1 hypothetical protein [Chloroflexota bacterium]
MADEMIDQGITRRGFLKSVAATAAAATVAGTGAALLLEKVQQQGSVVIPPAPASLPAVQSIQPAVNPGQQASDLLARLAAAQAENMQLKAQLDATQRQLAAVQPAGGSQNNPVADALQLQLDEANAEVGSLSNQIGVFSGLVALYEQLDGVDLAAVVGGGLASVGGVLGGLLDSVPSLTEGIQGGQQALNEFEAEIPLVDNGRRWLGEQLARVSVTYGAVEEALQNAVESIGSFLEMLAQWFQDVLKWLPFGIGDKAARVMDAMTNLLAETPNTISGLQINLVQPLDAWLAKEGDETQLHRRLIKPIREQALARATETIGHVQTVQSTYQAQLVTPAETTISEQQRIRELIAQYRQQNQV